jgi:protein-tyrosine phosphatase
MQTQFERHLPVKGTYNVRDLGGYATADGQTQWRRILRADGLHRLDDEGMAALVDAGVVTVIDLRRADELAQQPNPLSGNDAVSYHNISLFEDLAPTAERTGDALYDLYVRALATRREAIAQILTLIAEAPEGAVLFHCTAGKDRTGIIAALTLALAGVESGVIEEDYALTGKMIEPLIAEIVEHAAARGVEMTTFMPMLACEPATMAATMAHIAAEYGSVDAYLMLIGMAPEAVAKLKARLVGEV